MRSDDDARPLLLVVDDSPENLLILEDLLHDQYQLRLAGGGEAALGAAQQSPVPDLILLDVVMPDLDGHEVCRRLKAHPVTRHIPVIFLTALADPEQERLGLEAGAVDYLVKPVNPPIVLARVQAHLALKASTDFLRDRAAFLEEEVARRMRETLQVQEVTILLLASLAETRDVETGNHIRRTQRYVRALAERLRGRPGFEPLLAPGYIALLFKSAPLHDIGKVGIPDRILLKPGRLTPEEFAIMREHPALGRDTIQQVEDIIGAEVPFLALAKEIAYGHQEKWDGSGYPRGAAGRDIPLSARLMAVADVYDALISRRVYKDPIPHDDAVAIITASRGAHFDPDIVDAFLEIHEDFRAIAARYLDTEADIAAKRSSLARFAAEADLPPESEPG